MKVIILLLVLVAAYSASSVIDSTLEEEWQLFKKMHEKVYDNDKEEFIRRFIWQNNRDFINQHNKEAIEGLHTFTVKMNKFGDMTREEFNRFYKGFNATKNMHKLRNDRVYQRPLGFKIPDSIDWRKLGAVTPIQTQQQCASDWAFSSTASLEGQHFRATGQLIVLSAQNLMDCSTAQGNQGCSGGLMDQAFFYIKINNGIDTDTSYPYTAADGDCKFNSQTIGATLSGYADIKSGSEEDLTSATASIGPISVAFSADHPSFIFYWSGIYSDPDCSTTDLDHSVTVVGYGSLGPGQDYYIVKNSWGPTWGLDGYFWIARNKNNTCGIATMASYPIV